MDIEFKPHYNHAVFVPESEGSIFGVYKLPVSVYYKNGQGRFHNSLFLEELPGFIQEIPHIRDLVNLAVKNANNGILQIASDDFETPKGLFRHAECAGMRFDWNKPLFQTKKE